MEVKSNDLSEKSLYRELTLAIVIVVALASITVGLLNFFYSARATETQLNNKLSEYGLHLQKSLEWPLWNIDNELLIRIGKAYATNAEIASLTISDDKKHIVFQSENKNTNQIKRKYVIKHGGTNIGEVEIGLSLAYYEEKNRLALYISAVEALIAIMCLFIAVKWQLSKLLKKPIEALVDLTNKIVEGNYLQIDTPQVYVEFAPIISGLQTMSDTIANREANLRTEILERKSSQERLLLATTSGNIGIWDWDVVKNKLVWDKSMYKIYEIRDEDFIGAYEAWRHTLHPDDRQYSEKEMQAALRGEREYTIEFRIIRPDSTIRNIKSSSKTFFDQAGIAIRMLGTNIDITEQIKNQEKLRLATANAEAANIAKSTFLANMSHEIRTPMNAIIGMADLLSETKLDEQQNKYVDIFKKAGFNLLHTIDDILDISKIESGEFKIEKTEFTLQILVMEVYELLQIKAKEKNIIFNSFIATDIPESLVGDNFRIKQILMNLIGNALKFTTTGSISVRVGRNTDLARKGNLWFEITDTGIGISKEQQTQLFRPYYQVDSSSSKAYGGTGLGLAISKKIIEMLGGEIWMESEVGRGTKVSFTLDCEEKNELDIKTDIANNIQTKIDDQQKLQILHVEDSEFNRILIQEYLKNKNYIITEVENGKEAVDKVKLSAYDIILMDMQMPVMDGYTATKEIRKWEKQTSHPHIPIIAVTAYAMKEEQEKSLAAGCDLHLSKPILKENLMKVLEALR
jgi:signal transduction histidine kinase/ActR/RegA family two-component response regulator